MEWFIQRWQLEVTFHEVRTHLGVETQRQWSDQALARTTRALLGLFSLVTVLAHRQLKCGKLPTRQAAWYRKPRPTFADALASVRHSLWHHQGFPTSHSHINIRKPAHALLTRFTDALCYAE
jgi:hypothetical protein